MKLETFFESFDQFVDAPGAVAKMRRFILDLAVRGKLVAQDAKDESAGELLKRIQAEKARLIKSGEIRKQEQLPRVADDAIPFPLPAGWAASQLGDVAVCLDYMREPINVTERDLRIAGKAQSELFPYYGATQQQGWIDDFIFDTELVLLGEDGVPFLDDLRPKAYLISGKTWVNNHAHVFRGILVSNTFVMHWLNTFDYTGRVAGSTRSKLNQAKAVDIPIPLPPLAEQKRIVAKVDELMALCDRLEAQLKQRDEQAGVLAKAAVARFQADPTVENLEYLFDGRFDVPTPELRRLLLSSAMDGELIPFPDSTQSGVVGDHVTFLNGYAFKSEWFRQSGVRLCRNINVGHGALNWSSTECVSSSVAAEYSRFELFNGDIVLSLDRPIINSGLKAARIRECDLPCLLLQRVAKAVPRHDGLDLSYFFLWLQSPAFIDAIDPGRSNGVPHISTKEVSALPIRVPPLAEQRRIVAKVNELMALVDQLESQITASEEAGAKLLDALVAELAPSN
jgi:type I restriction enzyme, S subunit